MSKEKIGHARGHGHGHERGKRLEFLLFRARARVRARSFSSILFLIICPVLYPFSSYGREKDYS